jgi:hypothetical protein
LFRSASNFKEVNKSASRGAFSAGLTALGKYLKYLEQEADTPIDENIMQGAKSVLSVDLDSRKANRIIQLLQINVSLSARDITDKLYGKGKHQSIVFNKLQLMEEKGIMCKGTSRGTPYKWSLKRSSYNSDISDVNISQIGEPTTVLTDDERTILELILEERYTNGFRIDSIELRRLRRFVNDYAGIQFSFADSELIEAIKSCGIFFDNKVYAVKNEVRKKIKKLVEEYFGTGATAVFYEEFYIKNAYWLSEVAIASEEILKLTLRQLFPNLVFKSAYLGYTNANINAVLISEILRIWGDEILLNYEQISERLKYIPLERIKFVLSQNADFIWNSVEHFVHVSKIDINDKERSVIRETAQRKCEVHCYVSVTDLPVQNFSERNYELSLTAVHTAVFQLYLADGYERHGKIISLKGEKLDALEIMREYCRSLDKVALTELLAFELDLTGESHRWIPMQAGYDVMVRIDEKTYLAEKYVTFDTQSIDEALEHFIHGEYTPLRTVTTFALFPHCGQAWNLFLLESYVRRFSELFRFESPSVNKKNTGCIVRKNSLLNYDDIMADAIAKSNTTLKENTVADFLFENGYRGSRQKARLVDLIKKAKGLRESRD